MYFGTYSASCRDCRYPELIQGQTGQIIQDILNNGYKISDLELFHLDHASAEEFLEVYKGVVPEYHVKFLLTQLMLNQLTAGPCIVMEITSESETVARFRELVGPVDPELARKLRPNSLRAKYGVDKVKNAIHCTDLPDDGVLEVVKFNIEPILFQNPVIFIKKTE